jgi:hypothetical protein
MKITDYLFASISGCCIAIPFAQILPDIALLQGIEKLGIVGIMAAGILFFVFERRSYIAKSIGRLEVLENRIGVLEVKVTTDNEKIIHILGEQLEALKEIKNGQAENFSRMWQLTLKSISATININDAISDRLQDNEVNVLRQDEGQEKY